MNLQTYLNIVGSIAGALSGIWFGWSVLMTGPQEIHSKANEAWDASTEIATALALQSAQGLAGALLLGVSFLLQVLGSLTDQAIPLSQYPALRHTPLSFGVAVLLLLLVSWQTFSMRYQKLYRALHIPEMPSTPLQALKSRRHH